MTMERMQSVEGRAQMKDEIEAITLQQLNVQIKLKDDESMALATRLSTEATTLSHQEFTKLTEELHECIAKLDNLRAKRQRMAAQIIQ